jgi:hypothetical protein
MSLALDPYVDIANGFIYKENGIMVDCRLASFSSGGPRLRCGLKSWRAREISQGYRRDELSPLQVTSIFILRSFLRFHLHS